MDLGLGGLAEGLQLPAGFNPADPQALAGLDMWDLDAPTRRAVVLLAMGTRLILIAAVLAATVLAQLLVLQACALLRRTQRWRDAPLPSFLAPPRLLLMVGSLTVMPAAEAAGESPGRSHASRRVASRMLLLLQGPGSAAVRRCMCTC